MKQSLLSASASASAQVTQTLKRPLDSLKRRWQDCQRSSWGTVKPDEDSPFIPQSLNRIERRCRGDDRQGPGATSQGDIQLLARKRPCIEDDGVIEFQSLDEKGCANEAAADRSALVAELRMVSLGGLSQRELRMQDMFAQDTSHAVKQIGADDLNV